MKENKMHSKNSKRIKTKDWGRMKKYSEEYEKILNSMKNHKV